MAGYCLAWLLWWSRTPVSWVGFLFVIPMIDFMRLSVLAAHSWVYEELERWQ